jgi:hypothetical protein
MSRKAPIISLEQLKEKLSKFIDDEDEEFPYSLTNNKKIEQDLSKIEFDFENTCIDDGDGYNDYPCGYHVLPSGIPVLFVNAGGDWEFPICFCLYWDGKSARAYIPSDGNAIDTVNKSAYGNNGDYDDEIVELKVDPDKIIMDCNNRIQVND